MNVEQNLQARAGFFKALGNPIRLLIINLIRTQPRHTEELASIIKLSPGTVSHHLSILTKAGLLTSEKEQYYQTYSLVEGVLDRNLEDTVALPQPDLAANIETDAFTQKVLSTFFKRGRLIKIPSQRKKLLIVPAELAKAFEEGKTYTERDVNIVIADFYDDFATLRRELVTSKLLKRTRDGRVYKRVSAA